MILPLLVLLFGRLEVTLPTPSSAISAPAVARTQESVDATIQRAQSAWSKVRTLRASFDHSITNPITGSAMLSKGTLQQRKPNKLAISFIDPAGDRIVADGKFVWVFLQSATPGQVLKLSNTDVGAASTLRPPGCGGRLSHLPGQRRFRRQLHGLVGGGGYRHQPGRP